jgi:protein arginine N-methyltransferase 1
LPPYEHHIPSVIDARTRLMRPGGRLIPGRDRLFVACVEAADRHAKLTSPWSAGAAGVALPAAEALVVNELQKATFDEDALLTDAACWAEIDYGTVQSPDVAGRVRLRAARDGVAHGLAGWFETSLDDEVGFTTRPGTATRAAVYGNAFLPWPRPVGFARGDLVEVGVEARLVSGEYVWTWDAAIGATRFRQSTFFAAPLSAARMRRLAAAHVPEVDERADIDQAVLAGLRARRSLGEIAQEIANRWPARFPRWEDALAHVGETSERYERPA